MQLKRPKISGACLAVGAQQEPRRILSSLVLLTMVSTIFFMPVAAHAERGWQLAAKDQRASLYFSPDSVETTNERTDVAVVRNLHEPISSSSGRFASVFETVAINCQTLRIAVTSTLFFKRDFARGERIELTPRERQRVPPLDQILPPLFLMRVCGFNT
jgi:hypothetical protein